MPRPGFRNACNKIVENACSRNAGWHNSGTVRRAPFRALQFFGVVMRESWLGAVAVLAFGTVTNAAVILHVEDRTITASASPQSVTLNVWLEETGGTQANVSTYNVGVKLLTTGTVTFTGLGAANAAGTNTNHPSLFLGQTPTDRSVFAGYTPANGRYVTDDFVISGNAANAPVENGTRDGLYSFTLNVPGGTVGSFVLDIDDASIEVADASAIAIAFNPVTDFDNGLLTINPVPEPAALGLAMLGLPLILRRRR
jgi:hypothetical protein